MIVNFSGPKNISGNVVTIWEDMTAKEQDSFTVECDVKKYKVIYVRCGVRTSGAGTHTTVYSTTPLFTNMVGYTQAIRCATPFHTENTPNVYGAESTPAIVYDNRIVFNRSWHAANCVIRGLYGVV